MTAFPSHERNAFNSLALVVLRSIPGRSGTVTLRAQADALQGASTTAQVNGAGREATTEAAMRMPAPVSVRSPLPPDGRIAP